jgi:preprotein translocase subunit SecA
MAGRGTDIVLGGRPETAPDADSDQLAAAQAEWKARHEQVLASGGLHIIGTERHESRRIDNQLRGRSGRQGDPGSSRFYLSLEDNLMRIFGDPERMKTMLSRVGMKAGEAIESPLLSRQIERAQRKVEAHNFDLRKNLLEYDDVANDQRKVIYGHRNDLMSSDDIGDMIADLRRDIVAGLVAQAMPPETVEEHWNLQGLQNSLARDFGVGFDPKSWVDADKTRGAKEMEAFLAEALERAYLDKEALLGAVEMRRVERTLMLQMLDTHWREHLAAMDYMRQGIFLRSYAQKNPKQEYKREAFELFTSMLDRINYDAISLLARMQVRSEAEIEREEMERQARLERMMQFNHAEAPTLAGSAVSAPAEPESAVPFQREVRKIGRNEACPCGSGRKFKQCHGALQADEADPFPTVGRNDPCPCGSGQKYKHCHGALAE